MLNTNDKTTARKGTAGSNNVTSTNTMTVKNIHRPIMSRENEYGIKILKALKPGVAVSGYCVCCFAPSFCPLFSLCPCCAEAEYIILKRESSKYFHIRENSIEWNEPRIIMKEGNCFGVDPCFYDIQDNVHVLYFDDPIFDRLNDKTRFCNECRTCIFGGNGERIQVDAPCCFHLCQRASGPLPFLPTCCPSTFCPGILKYEIYLEDAQNGLYEISTARKKISKNNVYNKQSVDYLNK